MFPILYRDDHVVAIHKPAGLLVHRTSIDAHERRAAVQLLRRQLGRRVYPVHRLDKGASGVLLFALSRDVGRALNAQFAHRQVEKTYIAVVRGYPPEFGEIDYPLTHRFDGIDSRWGTGVGSSPPDIAVRSQPAGSGFAERTPAAGSSSLSDLEVCSDPPCPEPGRRGERAIERTPAAGPGARQAVTRFRRLATVELPHRVDRYPTSRYALLQLEPLTGRRHQLRRHLKHLSHPIIGDTTYGKSRHNRLFHDVLGCSRLLLACVELQLVHPVTRERLVCSATLTTDFARLLRALGWEDSLPPRWLPEGALPPHLAARVGAASSPT